VFSKWDLCSFSFSRELERLESVALRMGQPRGAGEEEPFAFASSTVTEEVDAQKLVSLESAVESVREEETPSVLFREVSFLSKKTSIWERKKAV